MWSNVNISAETGIPGGHTQAAYFPGAKIGIGGASSSGHAAQQIDIGGGRANILNALRRPASAHAYAQAPVDLFRRRGVCPRCVCV
jgi:hypothetical protein